MDRRCPELLQAVHDGDLDFIEKAITRDPSLVSYKTAYDSESSLDGATLLHVAARKGQVDVVKILLKHKADQKMDDDLGELPIHNALDLKQNKIVEILVPISEFPLHMAIASKRLELVKHVLKENPPHIVNVENHAGYTPLMQCILNEDSQDILAFLLEQGANPTAVIAPSFKSNIGGKSVLELAKMWSPKSVPILKEAIRTQE